MYNLISSKKSRFIMLLLMLSILVNPTNAQDFLTINNKYNILVNNAWELQKKKSYKEATEFYKKAFSFSKKDSRVTDYYNAACCFALMKKKSRSLRYLHKAAENHYSNYSHLIQDKDFMNLYKLKRWEQLMEDVKTNERNKQQLAKNLEALLKSDQQYRLMIDSIRGNYGSGSIQMKTLLSTISKIDSINLIKVTAIIDSIGWPGYNQADQDGALAVFLVVQHADLNTQLRYLPLFVQSARKGEAPWQNFALLQDRILISQGKKQIYGTQVMFDIKTKKNVFLPIEDEENVNKRRTSVGLQPIEEYAKLFNH